MPITANKIKNIINSLKSETLSDKDEIPINYSEDAKTKCVPLILSPLFTMVPYTFTIKE
jgi:hypothetical protein